MGSLLGFFFFATRLTKKIKHSEAMDEYMWPLDGWLVCLERAKRSRKFPFACIMCVSAQLQLFCWPGSATETLSMHAAYHTLTPYFPISGFTCYFFLEFGALRKRCQVCDAHHHHRHHHDSQANLLCSFSDETQQIPCKKKRNHFHFIRLSSQTEILVRTNNIYIYIYLSTSTTTTTRKNNCTVR